MSLVHGEKVLSYATGAIAILFAIVEAVLAAVQKSAKTHIAGYELNAALVAILGLTVVFFAWRSKRTGVIFGCALLFLVLGIGMGAVFLFSGGYLMIRALRLQRYGDASFSGSSKIARERAKARKEGRDPSTINATTIDATATTERPRPAPAASSRYTPKKQQRRRK